MKNIVQFLWVSKDSFLQFQLTFL